MAEFKYKCPSCETVSKTSEENYGKIVKCPKCDQDVQMPERPSKPKVAQLVEDEPEQSSAPQEDAGEKEAPSPAPEEDRTAPPTPPAGSKRAAPEDDEDDEEDEEEKDLVTFSPVMRGLINGLIGSIFLVLLGLAQLTGILDIESLLAQKLGLSISNPTVWTYVNYAAVAIAAIGLFAMLKTWIRVKTTRYRLTTERFLVTKGWLAKSHEEVELYRINDVSLSQSIWDRIVGTGSLVITSTDQSTPYIYVSSIPQAVARKEELRRAYRTSRKREGVVAGERFID